MMSATTKKIGVVDLFKHGLVVCLLTVSVGFGVYMKHFIDVYDNLNSKVYFLENKVSALETKHNEDIELLNNKIIAKKLTVTAYSASKTECDGDPKITASMSKVKPGTIAVSRDLFEQGWVFGKKVYIENHGIYTINDLMNKKHNERVDIVTGKQLF